MSIIRFAAAPLVVCLIASCSSSGTTGPQTGTVAGTVSSSLGPTLANVTVTVTPAGQSSLAAVETSSNGSYSVTGVPLGGGVVAVGSGVPSNCTAPSPASYSGLTGNGTQTVNITITCQQTSTNSTTTLSVGQTALFTDSSDFATNLTIAGNNDVYLVAIINTDSASSAMEDVTVTGAFTTAGASRVGPRRVVPYTKLQRRKSLPSLAHSPLDPGLIRDLRFLRKAEQGHVLRMEQEARYFQQRSHLQFGRQGSPIRASLVGTQVGDVNPVNVPGPNCSIQATIGARTVYAGQHVQVVADTSLTNWPQQYRPDSSYYAAFGQEYDNLTYSQHLLTYIGDPLQYDAQLSNVGKVTVVLTPQLNNYQLPGVTGGGTVLAFVSGCDFVNPSQAPSSNLTEMFYHLVPSANYSVGFWERELRPTAAHESKHIVSFGGHLANSQFLEQIWLEEGLAQVSSEVWGRNFNGSTWKGNNGFAQTLGCEVDTSNPCYSTSTPYTFVESHMAWLEQYLQTQDSVSESLNGTTPGRYGAGWSIARWAIDQFTNGTSAATEATAIKALITDYTANGLGNIANITGSSPAKTLAYWNLAVGLDTVSLLDSATFNTGAIDPLATVPSYDFRNIFSVAGNGKLYPLAAPLRPFVAQVGTINVQATGILGTDGFYLEVVGGSTAGTQTLQLGSGSGGPISPSSGFRVAIIRIQ